MGFLYEHAFLDEEEGRAVSHAIVMFSRAVTWLLVKAIRVCLFFSFQILHDLSFAQTCGFLKYPVVTIWST